MLTPQTAKRRASARRNYMKYEYYKTGKEWRWRLKAANGEIIASGEGYTNKKDLFSAMNLVRHSGDAPVIHAAVLIKAKK